MMTDLGGLPAATLLDAMTDATVIVDADGVIRAVNRAWRDFSQGNAGTGDYLGTDYFETCAHAEGRDSAEAGIVLEGLRRCQAGGMPFRCEYPCHSPDEERWFELVATRLHHEGRPHLLIQHRNITRRVRLRNETRAAHLQAETLAALVSGTSDAILSYDLEGRIITWNKAAETLYGYTADQAVGQRLDMLYPPDWPVPLEEYRDRIIAGELTRFEAVRIARDGTRREVWVTGAPIRGADGEVVAVSNIHRDVTELRQAERAREVVAKEVIHRAKNMLAVVTAIYRQTSRRAGSIEEFSESFGARIQALARSTDLLVAGNWQSVPMAELARSELGLFSPGPDGTSLRMDGPDVLLLPQAVQVLGMALHELATNSAKYGAFKHNSGSVGLNWQVDPAHSSLLVEWREPGDILLPGTLPGRGAAGSGDGNAADPGGFGSTVLTSFARSMLNGEAELSMVGGVTWRLSIPSEHFSLPGQRG